MAAPDPQQTSVDPVTEAIEALDPRALAVYTNDGYVFPGGETTYSFGNSPESGTYCMPGTA